ncbi:MAG: hydantoinase B/oxoprolinase family protein [Phycisphaeraceae bacterium]|nr:hydantoinase B/oxoprolinase family protein [Phycisphaeraceae bacterium]
MPDTDPIELEVFRHLFASVAEEMGERLMRSAYSPNIKERRDFSCALFDANGEMLAQAAHIPVHLGSTPMAVRAVIDAFGLDQPGGMGTDAVYVLNDPYAGGTHLPDITVVQPLLLPGTPGGMDRPAFYLANRAHHADVGGVSPGSLPISKHIDDEGLRITPRVLDGEAVQWIANASRTPGERRGDLQAQLAALRVGAARLQVMAGRYGLEVLTQRGDDLIAYTERIVRRLIASLPDGDYAFEDMLDDDGFGATDIALRCALQIKGECATVDFSGSADQVAGPVNAVRAIALSAVNYCFRCLLPADLPSNSGVMRPIQVVTRAGSVVDAAYPAPVAGGNVETSQRLVDVVFGALANLLPGRIPAASCGSMNNVTFGGEDPRHGGRPFAYYETLAGGVGASPEAHGASALHSHMTNTLNTPIEVFEHAYPVRITRYAIREGSGGVGSTCGGDGVTRAYQFDVPAAATLLTERRRSQPYGLQGGRPGATGSNTLTNEQGETTELPAKKRINLKPGQTLTVHTPGGGGFGGA